MKLNIILIYLLKVTEQNDDFALKKKLLDNWDVRDNYADARDDIVFDYDIFKDDFKGKPTDNYSDEIIILSFFSDEVLSLDDIPEDTNWNFVEINSATDLLAMENPHQKKYKTQSYKSKTKAQKKSPKKRKNHNNWDKFKSRFPIYVERGFEPVSQVVPDISSLPTRKEKRQVDYPVPKVEISEDIFIASQVNPWEKVNIIEDKSPQLAFGAYDEFGNKIQQKRNNPVKPVHYRDFKDLHKFGVSDEVIKSEPLLRNKKEIGNHDQIINITIDLEKLESDPKIQKLHLQSQHVAGFNQFQAIKDIKPVTAPIPSFQVFKTNIHKDHNDEENIKLAKTKNPSFQVFKAKTEKRHNKKIKSLQKPQLPYSKFLK